MKKYDVAVIGGGSAGFAAAIRSAELNKKAVLIEQGTIGGTCVNVGCIPSKYIINQAFLGTCWKDIKEGRDKLVRQLRRDKYLKVIESYFENVDYISGTAEFIDEKTISVDNSIVISADKYIIAAGSKPAFPDIPGMDYSNRISSSDLIFINELPESLIIVGGRSIALEMGQAFAMLGVDVTILQRSSYLLPHYDPVIGTGIRGILKNQGIEIITDTGLLAIYRENDKKTIEYSKDSKRYRLSAEEIVFATGREGNTEYLNLNAAGINTGSNGRIITDENLMTSNPDVFAAGDVVDSPGFVYVAAKEGQSAVSNSFSVIPEALDYSSVPKVIFTHPQIARVGISKKVKEKSGLNIESRVMTINETPYGITNGKTEGVVRISIDSDSRKVLSAQIMAEDAGNLIQVITMAIKAGMTIEGIIDTYFPYLTAAEGIKLCSVIFNRDAGKLSCCAG